MSAEDSTASNALNNIDIQIDQITKALQVNGVGKSDLKTSSISVYPRYNYSAATTTIIGYTVYVSLSVTVRDIDTDT